MKTKKARNYIYEGLGFPVELEEIEMVFIDGEWHPKIDVRKVSDEVITKLAFHKSRLTGNQVRFIRSWFSMPLRKFGEEVVHESHMAVSKWEKKGNLPTSMNPNTEHELRLYIVEQLLLRSRTAKSKFYDLYMQTKNFLGPAQGSSSFMVQVRAA